MKFLKNHPFAVEAFFKSSLVLTFAVPKEQVQSLIPECLSLDTFQDKWAFIAVAMVDTSGLRPKGFPNFMGNNFFLIGYRLFVRYTNLKGKRLRGLYILQSETNKKKMEIFGNIFTNYKYRTIDISIHENENEKLKEISSINSNFQMSIDQEALEVDLPEDSPFLNWKEARRFAGPMPFTFSYNEENKNVTIIKGVRSNWNPKPIKINKYKFGFLDGLKLKGLCLANAFEINDIPYHWEKGKIEKWS